jgi:hypothetical protein
MTSRFRLGTYFESVCDRALAYGQHLLGTSIFVYENHMSRAVPSGWRDADETARYRPPS